MTVAEDEVYLTVNEVAAKLRVTGGAVRAWLGSGRLRGIRLPADRQGWRIRQSDLETFLRQLERHGE